MSLPSVPKSSAMTCCGDSPSRSDCDTTAPPVPPITHSPASNPTTVSRMPTRAAVAMPAAVAPSEVNSCCARASSSLSASPGRYRNTTPALTRRFRRSSTSLCSSTTLKLPSASFAIKRLLLHEKRRASSTSEVSTLSQNSASEITSETFSMFGTSSATGAPAAVARPVAASTSAVAATSAAALATRAAVSGLPPRTAPRPGAGPEMKAVR
mmetsp:Transcript_91869/g.230886  ORF Transcript_91869/g.230886 Transcript_91869/m.230886 type:complete len:211 (+) Transcript_91869:1775-2407(+)